MLYEDVKYIVIHCSATKPEQDIGADEIDEMHKKRGWRGIGYHYVIRRDGRIEAGRRLDETGAHCKGHNRESWGICLIGGVDSDGKPEDNFTDRQSFILQSLVETLKHSAPKAEVLGHRDLSPDVDGDGIVEKHEWLKDCPCFDVKSWWAEAKRINFE